MSLNYIGHIKYRWQMSLNYIGQPQTYKNYIYVERDNIWK